MTARNRRFTNQSLSLFAPQTARQTRHAGRKTACLHTERLRWQRPTARRRRRSAQAGRPLGCSASVRCRFRPGRLSELTVSASAGSLPARSVTPAAAAAAATTATAAAAAASASAARRRSGRVRQTAAAAAADARIRSARPRAHQRTADGRLRWKAVSVDYRLDSSIAGCVL